MVPGAPGSLSHSYCMVPGGPVRDGLSDATQSDCLHHAQSWRGYSAALRLALPQLSLSKVAADF